jgi:hypothetical protein
VLKLALPGCPAGDRVAYSPDIPTVARLTAFDEPILRPRRLAALDDKQRTGGRPRSHIGRPAGCASVSAAAGRRWPGSSFAHMARTATATGLDTSSPGLCVS